MEHSQAFCLGDLTDIASETKISHRTKLLSGNQINFHAIKKDEKLMSVKIAEL